VIAFAEEDSQEAECTMLNDLSASSIYCPGSPSLLSVHRPGSCSNLAATMEDDPGSPSILRMDETRRLPPKPYSTPRGVRFEIPRITEESPQPHQRPSSGIVQALGGTRLNPRPNGSSVAVGGA